MGRGCSKTDAIRAKTPSRDFSTPLSSLNHRLRINGVLGSLTSGLWGLRPPGASRCCARASLRTPSRPHPPHDGASPGLYPPDSETLGDATRRNVSVYPYIRIGVKGVPGADS